MNPICWLIDHAWSPSEAVCERCGLTYMQEVERGTFTLPQHLGAGVSLFKHLVSFPTRTERNWTDGSMTIKRLWCIQIGSRRFGFERSPIYFNGAPYMTRYIMYLGWVNLRLHQFFRGDDDRASHTHPWWFITFPFTDYVEEVYDKGQYCGARVVRARRFHFRKASHEHIVKGPVALWFKGCPVVWDNGCQSPFWTFVIAGSKVGDWGFYPTPGKFVPWQEFKP